MVNGDAEHGGSPQLRTLGADDAGRLWSCPVDNAAVCGHEEGHVYDTRYCPVCPKCGSPERLMVGKLLSPEILHPRLVAALKFVKKGGVR